MNKSKSLDSTPKILDVGGRKSPYTIGIPAEITIIDLPRDSEIQQKLNLGINSTVIRSNHESPQQYQGNDFWRYDTF